MTSIDTITRKQLKSYGASDYLVRCLTKAIAPQGKQGRSNLYSVSEIITEIDEYSKRRIREATRELLKVIRAELLKISLDITGDDPIDQLAAEILEEHSKFQEAVAVSKKREEDFYSTHGDWINRNLVKRNEIVAFRA
ncbi:MAG: hypothetical protein VKK04_00255 [Synechococcales bacterium]|nr:hypothetical protein [Synechococcales bacterium]